MNCGSFGTFNVTRGENERAGSLDALYLTNVQQLHERPEADDNEPDVRRDARPETAGELATGRGIRGPFPRRRGFRGRGKPSTPRIACLSGAVRQQVRIAVRPVPADRRRRSRALCKLPEQFGFVIEYTDAIGNLRHYEPDFVAVLADGTHNLIETKGQEDVNVAHKDRAAKLWCENATLLTGQPWAYLKVRQSEFDRLQPTSSRICYPWWGIEQTPGPPALP